MNNRYSKKSVIKLLEDAIASARLDRAEFSRLFPENPTYPTSEKEVTGFIKERVKVHHDSWVIGPIEQALSILRGDKGR